ncbi:MAG: tRNA (guanine(10)-N(2))-dimethyltransferase, partial [Candidatus Bathyarchaeia archaeon]
ENDKIARLISLIKEEAEAPITYYVVDNICEKIRAPTPPLKEVINNIEEAGFRAFRTHLHDRGIKTDAPASLVIEAVKRAVKNRV